MTEKTRVTISTRKMAELPQIGQRKIVRVNGGNETLYVQEVNYELMRNFDNDDGDWHLEYAGSYTLVPYRNL